MKRALYEKIYDIFTLSGFADDCKYFRISAGDFGDECHLCAHTRSHVQYGRQFAILPKDFSQTNAIFHANRQNRTMRVVAFTFCGTLFCVWNVFDDGEHGS